MASTAADTPQKAPEEKALGGGGGGLEGSLIDYGEEDEDQAEKAA